MIQIIWMMGRPAEEGVLRGSGRLYYDGELVCKTERAVAAHEGEGETLRWSISRGVALLVHFCPRMSGIEPFLRRSPMAWAFCLTSS